MQFRCRQLCEWSSSTGAIFRMREGIRGFQRPATSRRFQPPRTTLRVRARGSNSTQRTPPLRRLEIARERKANDGFVFSDNLRNQSLSGRALPQKISKPFVKSWSAVAPYSYAPISHPPTFLAYPRWSWISQQSAAALIALLPARSAIVWVGPPLFCNGPVDESVSAAIVPPDSNVWGHCVVIAIRFAP